MTKSGVVHVVDDDNDMRQSLAALLEDSGFEALQYNSAEAFLSRADLAGPACVVCDVRMPGMDGLELLKRLRGDGVALPLILVTGHGDVPLAVTAMKAGADDFLEKPFEADALLSAVEAAFAKLGDDAQVGADLEARQRISQLTLREREVLERLVAGESNKEAAKKLGVSHRTVEFHRAHIIEKTGARGLPDLVRLWITAHPNGGHG